jgi:hypothetical protein
MKTYLNKTIWITWETQRRTEELSKALGIKLYKIIYDGNYIIRYLLLSIKTIVLLIKIRPNKVIVQNPSIVLTTVICFLEKLFRYKIIVDRHTNFKFSSLDHPDIKLRIFHFLSKYTIRKADLTIITNESLRKIVNERGGNGFVLQDKIPELKLKEKIPLRGKNNLVFIASFSGDEPIEEVMKAARLLNPDIFIYITGNYKKVKKEFIENAPTNIVFTGFLNEKDYQSLLYCADVLIALTTQEHTLLCGAYEGVSLLKPLIISNKNDLRNYFYKGVVATNNNSNSISKSIITALENYDLLKKDIIELYSELKSDWELRFDNLLIAISNL